MPKFTVEMEKCQIVKSVVAVDVEADNKRNAAMLAYAYANDGEYDSMLTVVSIRSSYEVDYVEELEN